MAFYLIFTYLLIAILFAVSSYDSRRIVCVEKGELEPKRHSPTKKNSSYDNGLVWFFVIVAIILVLGLRGVKTGDYEAYEILFNKINSESAIVHPDKSNFLYDWICRIVFLLGGSVNSVFFIVAIITILFFALGIRYCACNRYLFIGLFLLSFQYFDLFNIVRQGVTDGIGFFVICKTIYNKENDKKDGLVPLLLLVVAALFHSTGWFFLIIYLFLKIYKKKFFFVAELITLLCVSLFSTFLANSDLFSKMLSSFFGSVWRDGTYNVEMELGLREIGEGIFGIIVWAIFRFKGKRQSDYWFGFLTWLFVIARFMTPNFRILFRIADCCVPFFLVSILQLPIFFKGKFAKNTIIILAFCFYILFFFFKIKGYTSFYDYQMIKITDLFR